MGKRGDTRWDGAKDRKVGRQVDYEFEYQPHSGLDDLGLESNEMIEAMQYDAVKGLLPALKTLLEEHNIQDLEMKDEDPRMRLLIQAARVQYLRAIFPDADVITEYLTQAAIRHQLPFYAMAPGFNSDGKHIGWVFAAEAGTIYRMPIIPGPANKSYANLYKLLLAEGDYVKWKDLGLSMGGQGPWKAFLTRMKKMVAYMSRDDVGMKQLANVIDSWIPREVRGRKSKQQWHTTPVRGRMWHDHVSDPRFEHRQDGILGMFRRHGQNHGVALQFPGNWYQGPRMKAGTAPDAFPPGWNAKVQASLDFTRNKVFDVNAGRTNAGAKSAGDAGGNYFVEGASSTAFGNSRGKHGMGTIAQKGDYMETEAKGRIALPGPLFDDPVTLPQKEIEAEEKEALKQAKKEAAAEKAEQDKVVTKPKGFLGDIGPKVRKTLKIKAPKKSNLPLEEQSVYRANRWDRDDSYDMDDVEACKGEDD